MKERSYILFPGLLVAGQLAGRHRVGYARLLKRVERSIQGIPPVGADLIAQLQIADVLQAQEYPVPNGQTYQDSNVDAGGLAIAANAFVEGIITEPAGASELVMWIESEATIPESTDVGWTILTAGMLQARFATEVYDAVAAGIIRLGQSDPVPQLLTDTIEVIRGAVRSGGKVLLGPTGTIPGSARRYALMLAKADLLSAAQDIMPDFCAAAQKDAESAESWLKDVRRGLITPEPPEVIQSETPAGPSPSFGDKRREFTRRTEDGI